MNITLLAANHVVLEKDPTGDLHRILRARIDDVDLVAEEAAGVQITVARRLAYEFDKRWIDIDMTVAERKLACGCGHPRRLWCKAQWGRRPPRFMF